MDAMNLSDHEVVPRCYSLPAAASLPPNDNLFMLISCKTSQLYVTPCCAQEEVWNQMQQYWALQQKLEQEFLETLEGPAVNMCGLTPQQLTELQTSKFTPHTHQTSKFTPHVRLTSKFTTQNYK